MTTLEEIKSYYQPYCSVDLDEAYRSFWMERGSADANEFLRYLYERGYLGSDIYRYTRTVEPGADSGSHGQATATPGRPPQEQDPERRYQMRELLGEGGMGEVWEARDLVLQRKVAYKAIRAAAREKATVLARFLDEARVTAQLDHPNVVPVYNLEANPGGGYAFTMKKVEGQTLAELIGMCRAKLAKRVPLEDALRLPARLEHFLKVCDAIAYAHSKGVIHRDLKPANIMVGRYHEVYVMDWGIARLIGGGGGAAADQGDDGAIALGDDAPADGRTMEGQVVGTPGYMSPEQALGRNQTLDGRSDQFALGAILYELVCLHPAFRADSAQALLLSSAAGARRPVEHALPGHKVPTELHAIIEKATAHDVADRYPSVGALADDVRRYLRGEAVAARPDNLLQKTLRFMSRHRQATLLAFIGILLLSACAVIWSLLEQQRAAASARERERRLTAFQSAVARRSHLIDARFQSYATALRSLASAAVQLIRRGTPSDEAVFSNDDFGAELAAPPDLDHSPLYRKPVSIDWPVYKLAPGTRLSDVEPLLRRLIYLRHHYKRMFLHSRADGAGELAPEDARRLLFEQGVPLRWAYLGLVQGVMFSYPGKKGYPPEYDPRRRPWYQLAEGRHGVFWGNTYIDLQGQGMLLPCVTSMYDESGVFLGVAGVELTFDDIIAKLLRMPGQPDVIETFLVDDEGGIVVRSSVAGLSFEEGKLHGAMRCPPFPLASVRSAAASGRSGFVEERLQGRDALVVYWHLPTIGWSYVVWADAPGLLRLK